MSLTRAQLLSGNSSQGVVLAGQTQGVTAGTGLVISSTGSISFDSATALGTIRTNNPSAYNSYVWPTLAGSAGQQLTLGSGGSLTWENADNIPWTSKGQLIVGTGLATDAILNVGSNGTLLIADSTATTGLSYTSNYVSGITAGSNISISGSTGNVTISVVPGGSVGTITGVTAGTGLSGGGTSGTVTLTNAGVTSLVAGPFITLSGSTGDITISSSDSGGTITGVTAGTGLSGGGTSGNVTLTNTGVTSLVAGTNITLSSSTGSVTINSTSGGGTVSSVDVSGGSTGLTFTGGPITTSGTITASGTLALASGGTGATTQATAANNILPSQAGNSGYILTTDASNTSWVSLGTVGLTSWSGGTTGLTPSVATTGAITVSGTLALASGGTGATTQATAANNILPSQAGNVGDFLTTDGTNVSWSTTSATDIPSGTVILFMQAAAPTGWTQVTTQNNVGIRIVNTAGGGTGGTIPFSTLFSATATYTGSVSITSGQVGDTSLTTAQLAVHSHGASLSTGNAITSVYGANSYQGGPGFALQGGSSNNVGGSVSIANEGSGDPHTHSLVGVVAGGNFSSNFDLEYVDVIAASKN